MADVWVINGGIVEARISFLVDASGLSDGQTAVPVSAYAESVVGHPLAWPTMQRNALLAATDWTMAPDAPLTADQVTAARAYRAALRNLPATSPAAASVAWPAAPSFITP